MEGLELNYLIYNKEILAIVKGIEKWYLLLLRLTDLFEVLTNYYALQYFMTKWLLIA